MTTTTTTTTTMDVPDEGPGGGLVCPLPVGERDEVVLAHGGGGRLMHELIEVLAGPGPGQRPRNDPRHDGAVLHVRGTLLAMSTDSYVVRPLFFPGGDIGRLAVHGTVNDLAMCGARPLYLSAAFILEEGLPMAVLRRVAASLQQAAAQAEVEVVTGDTKVVERGKGDAVFITTTGVGVIEHGLRIGPASVRPGDVVLLSGDIGRHGVAILAAREGLSFDSEIESDTAPLWGPVRGLLEAGLEVHCLRDLTRGGLASALVEIAEGAGVSVQIEEGRVPVREDVRGACEVLGLDVLHVANEGRFVCLLPAAQAAEALAVLRACGQEAACIGEVLAGQGQVTARGPLGAARIVDMLSGEQLPRIC